MKTFISNLKDKSATLALSLRYLCGRIMKHSDRNDAPIEDSTSGYKILGNTTLLKDTLSLKYPLSIPIGKTLRRIAANTLCLLTLGTGQMWADGGIGYKGVKFTKNGEVTEWYNIHNVDWGYSNASYDCRSGQSGVTDFNNANLGTVTTLKLKAFVVIGWTNSSDYVAGRLQYRLYKQSASAPSYTNYNVGNYGSTSNSSSAANVLASSNNDRVVGSASLTTDIVTSSTAAGNYYLQLKGLGRMQWSNGSSYGNFNANDGSEVKATLLVPGFETTSTSQAFGSVNIGSNSSATKSFTRHYGTALTTSNCAITGTNSGDFSVTSISETGVTIRFAPSSAGSKSATLTIIDANSKTCTISLTGTGTTPPGLTVVAGTGISAVTGSDADISAGDNIAITATVATGYTWNRWTLSGSGTLSTFTATTKNQTVTVGTAGTMTLTASATENMSSLSTSCHYDAGTPGYSAPTMSVSSIGISTTAMLTAATPSTGYTFAGWTLSSNIVVTSGNKDTDLSITIRTNGNGAAATAQANYTEDLSSPYVIKGGTAITGGTAWTTEIAFTKKSGESTGSIAYAEVPISTALTSDAADTKYNFKVVNGSTWYGLGNSGDWWYSSSSGEQILLTTGQNIQLRANVVGTYIVKLDYTTPASPKITITWPTALQIYRSNPNDATNVGDHAWNSMPSSTSYRWLLDLEANTTYEFKINDKGTYYGNNTDITTSFSNRDFSTGTSDTKLITKSAGTFTFTWDATNHRLTVQYPKSAYIDASPASVYTGGTTTLTGYASELGSGSHTITYEFYKGTTLTDANKIATKNKTASGTYQQETQSVTVDFAGNTTDQVYTIQIKEGGSVLATNTVTVYRQWDIYVHDVASWGGMYNYMWDNGEYVVWPGVTCPAYNGSTTGWYQVTIDAKYPKFQLNCNNCENTMRTFGGDAAYTPNLTSFPAGSYWYTEFNSHGGDGHDYYTLHSITITNPTVAAPTLEKACENQLTLKGQVTNNGGDGTTAAEMKEVGFTIGGVDYAADCTDGAYFYKTITGLTVNTAYSVTAYAENIHGKSTSSSASHSTLAHTTHRIQVRSTQQPYLYAWTDNPACNTGKIENGTYGSTSTGAMTTTGITSALGTWYYYDLPEQYDKFLVTIGNTYSNWNTNKTNDTNNPKADQCYYYWNGSERATQSERFGTMACPYLTPQLMIESTAGSGSYSYNEMTGSGTINYTITLTAEATYKFKIVYNSDYYTKSGTILTANTPTSAAFTVEDGSDNEAQLKTTIAGSYTFSFNTSTKVVTVTYPALPSLTPALSNASSTQLIKTSGSILKGDGTEANPYYVFAGKNVVVTASFSSPSATGKLYIKFTDNGTEQSERGAWSSLSSADKSYTITPASASDDVKYISVKGYYKYNGDIITSTITESNKIYYKIVETPTVSISVPDEVKTGKSFDATYATENTSVTGVTAPTFQLYFKMWNGSAWAQVGSYDYYHSGYKSDNPKSVQISGTSPYTAGFYQWYVKMSYGGQTFESSTVQNAIYDTYQVTITTTADARTGNKDWFTSVYAWRATDASGDTEQYTDFTPSYKNGNYPGQRREDCCIEVADHTYIYTFKTPIYTHIKLGDNSNNATNQTANIQITGNTCIELNGLKGQATNNWKFTKTDDCGGVYYRVESDYNGFTYYSNAVQNSGDQLSFFAAKSGSTGAALRWMKLENGSWSKMSKTLNPSSTKSGVYVISMNASYGPTPTTLTDAQLYSGDYYVRTDLADGGWENYTNADNKMTYFDDASSTYNHYWVTYTGDDGDFNIDAEVGNSINRCLARRIEDRGTLADGSGKVNAKNVRYSYNTKTGWFDYAVIGASTATAYVFLSAYGADADKTNYSTKVFRDAGHTNATKENSADDQIKFRDLSNWQYQADIYVQAPAGTDSDDNVTIGIEARLPGKSEVQEIVSNDKPLEILGQNTTGGAYVIRAIYDYKTNTIVAGWLPNNPTNISSTTTIEGNLILNRVDRGSVQQINIDAGKELRNLKVRYASLEIKRDGDNSEFSKVHGACTLWKAGDTGFSGHHVGEYKSGGTSNADTNLYYWISLPYTCDVSSVFGLPGAYGDKWGFFRYRGDLRAENGFWVDSETYWEFVEHNETLNAYEGYVLAIDLRVADFHDIVIEGTNYSSLFVYFPSTPEYSNKTLTNHTNSISLTPYICEKSGRENYDSGWHIVGVPGYNDVYISSTSDPEFAIGEEIPAFFYDYTYNGSIYGSSSEGSSTNNAYKYYTSPTEYGFKAFHGYCIQYNGTINWRAATDNKASIRRRAPKDEELPFEVATLELLVSTGGYEQDNTFVRLQNEGATEDFDLNLDLTKVKTKKLTNIYSLTGEHELAGNCLPIETQVVPLGILAPEDDEYTISLRDGVPSGLQAILVDTETRLETDLSKDDYTLSLPKGTHNGRLQLRLGVQTTDIGTDIEHHNSTGGISATITNGDLLLSGLPADGCQVRVFDPAGKMLYDAHTARGQSIALPAGNGVYLVTAGGETLKVVK